MESLGYTEREMEPVESRQIVTYPRAIQTPVMANSIPIVLVTTGRCCAVVYRKCSLGVHFTTQQ